MNGSILNKPIVLVLNRNWMRISYITPKEAIIRLCGDNGDGNPPLLAMSIEMDENGNLIEGTPTRWEDWVKLPVREQDIGICTKGGAVRCPTVVITPSYDKMPRKTPAFSPEAVKRRDRGICQVSGRKLKDGEGNLGHIRARAKGGPRTWGNIVYMDRKLNTMQGTRTPEEMGWKLLKEPKEPAPLPVAALVSEVRHPTHKPFVK